jgi:hypothetical protein
MIPAITLAYSENGRCESSNSKLRSIKPTMLRDDLPPLAKKVIQLYKTRPAVAAVVERLVDDFLAEVS